MAAPPPWTVCKHYLRGRCNRPHCKYRHNVPGLVVVNQLPPPERDQPGEMTLLVDGHIKATFAEGIVPVTVEDMHSSKLGLQIKNVNASVITTWSPPARTLMLKYDSHSVAFRARTKLIGTILPGASLNCALSDPDPEGVFTLRIFDLPWRVSSDKILAALPDGLRPSKNIVQIEPRHVLNLGLVREAIAELTKLEPICVKDSSSRTSHKVKLWFASQRLDGVARMLDGQRLRQLGGTRIAATEAVEVQLTLHPTIYQRYKGLLKSCAHNSFQRNQLCNVHFGEKNHVPGTPVQVVISGANREVVMEAKKALDTLLIHNTVGRLSPPPKPPQQKHRIVLSKTTDYLKVIRGDGLHRAQKELGALTVYMEYTTEPPAIVVWGDTFTLRKAQRHLSPDGSLPDSKKSRCEVCWDECDDYVKVKDCLHISCKDCFVQYCKVSRDSKFPLQCFQTKCEGLLEVDEVRSALGEDAFHRLASEAIETYFRRETAHYIRCSGPDCTAYFSASESGTYICPSCFTTSCCNCKVEYHFGESCEAYKDRMAGSEEKFQKWMEQEGAKYCPRCNMAVQKAVGCNHMTCGYCDQHFCFTCLKMFDNPESVYRHMSEKHGGYYGNEREAREAEELAIREALGVGWLEAVEPNLQPNGHPRGAEADIRLPPPAGRARDPAAPDQFIPAPVLMPRNPRARPGDLRAVRWAQGEIDEQLARGEGFAELFDDDDEWIEDVWGDVGFGGGGMW